jgi:hypothetical protein
MESPQRTWGVKFDFMKRKKGARGLGMESPTERGNWNESEECGELPP